MNIKHYNFNIILIRDLDNFYIWKFIKDKTPYLPKKYKVAKLEYEKVINVLVLNY